MPFADELLGDRVAEALIATVAAAAPGHGLPALRAAAAHLAGRPLRERSDLLRDALLANLPAGGLTQRAGAASYAVRRACRKTSADCAPETP